MAIVDLFATGQVTLGDTARVAVTLESSGFDRRPVKVELKDGDEVSLLPPVSGGIEGLERYAG